MGTSTTLRKAYGALKDKTEIALAKVSSNFKEFDIAIVKATNHVECPPKERHVRKIFAATSISRPQTDIAYCIQALSKRLSKTRSWIVATKILIVIHRALREGDPTFRDELLNYAHRGNSLQANFKDDSSGLGWDCHAWVKTYAFYLEEKLQCFEALGYDIGAERLTKSPTFGSIKGLGKTITNEELIDQLPALQNLLSRLIGCQPEGASYNIYLIQYVVALLLKESFKIYCAINDGIIKLMDVFFEMSQEDAVKALDIYKRAGQQVEELGEFYEYCKGLELAKNFQFPTLRQPPPSFLATMEEYVKEAPQTRSVQNRSEYERREQASPDDSVETEKQEEENNKLLIDEQKRSQTKKTHEEPQQLIPTGDLLDGPYETNPKHVEIEKSNPLTLAIVPTGTSLASRDISERWELALFTAPSNQTTHVVESKLASGSDKFSLDSLYEDEVTRRQKQLTNAGYAYGVPIVQNSLQRQQHLDAYLMSNHIAPPPSNVQISILTQQQQQPMMLQQQQQMILQQQQPTMMIMVPYQYPQQLQMQHKGYFNPFGDPSFNIPPDSTSPQANHKFVPLQLQSYLP